MAARYAIASRDEAKAQAIYQRYVATGAYQPWAKTFGGTCPPPDFEAAKTFWQRRVTGWIEKTAGSAWRHIGLVLAVVVAAMLLAVVVRRSRAAAHRHS